MFEFSYKSDFKTFADIREMLKIIFIAIQFKKFNFTFPNVWVFYRHSQNGEIMTAVGRQC